MLLKEKGKKNLPEVSIMNLKGIHWLSKLQLETGKEKMLHLVI